MQPAIIESDSPRSMEEVAFVPASLSASSYASGEDQLEDPLLRKLRAAIDGYRARVAAWEQAVKPLAEKQNSPTVITTSLFVLGGGLCVAINAMMLRGDAPIQEVALSNLSCVALFVIAAISLFYDRVLRGFGRELVLRRSGDQASEIAVQLHALAAIQVDLQYRVQRLSRDLNELSLTIESQNEIAEDLKKRNLEAAAEQRDYESRLSDLRGSIMNEASRLNRFQHSMARLENERKELELTIQAHTDHLFDIATQRENASEELSSLEYQRESVRAALVAEQEQHRMEAARLGTQLRLLIGERDSMVSNLESIKADLVHLGELRSEMQTEIELIGEEQERRTEASIAAITKLQSQLESLQQEYDRNSTEFAQVHQALRNAHAERQGLETQIAECKIARTDLEDALSDLLGRLNVNREELQAVEFAIEREQEQMNARRAQAEREAIEAESRQQERNRLLQELERGIGNALQERELLGTEVQRLTGVKDAMEITIDELTHRLEMRTTDLRRKQSQLQEQADRLERLSEAIQRLTIRESEMRQSVDSIGPAIIESLPSPHGTTWGVHGPHISGVSRSRPLSSSGTDELIEG